jgi:hypothetical protein
MPQSGKPSKCRRWKGWQRPNALGIEEVHAWWSIQVFARGDHGDHDGEREEEEDHLGRRGGHGRTQCAPHGKTDEHGMVAYGRNVDEMRSCSNKLVYSI